MTDGGDSTQLLPPTEGPWKTSFTIDDVKGGPIKLRQIGKKRFLLKSKIYFGGETGLGKANLDATTTDDIRTLPAGAETDLASVPGPLRWFVGTYGIHTPAVLIHDRLIPTPKHLDGKMTDQYADRYLRFMLQDLGMRWLKRWVMWAGVALRTRWAAGGVKMLSVLVWIVAALAGMTTFVIAAVNENVGWMIFAAIAIFVFAGLWEKQYGAGIVAGLAAPWLLPPAVLAVIGLAIYVMLEFVLGWVWGRFAGPERRGSGSYRPDGI